MCLIEHSNCGEHFWVGFGAMALIWCTLLVRCPTTLSYLFEYKALFQTGMVHAIKSLSYAPTRRTRSKCLMFSRELLNHINSEDMELAY